MQPICNITVLMYNPEGSDNNKEYLEIYTDLNLENYTIKDLYSQDTLTLIKQTNSSYSLIVEENFNHTNINATIYSVGATIGNNLNNDGDLISIYGPNLLDAVHYYEQWGASNNGKSLCKINQIWQECTKTPGYSNENIQLNDYTIRITEFLPDPQGNDASPMPDGEWIELFNYGILELDLTGIKLKDKANHELIISDTTTYEQIIKPNEYLIIYANNKSGFLNNDGLEEIQLLTPEEIEIEKIVYSDSREGNSWSKINNAWHLTIPTPGEDNPNNKDEGKESKIEIQKIYLGNDNKAKFGDNLRIKLNIYKGDETKESIKAYIQKNKKKISKTTSFNINQKFSENIITIPIQIFPNCNLKKEEGKYELVVEGLDEKDTEYFEIKGITQNLCEKQTCTEENLVNYMEEINFETVINSDSQPNEIIYESKGKKTSKSGIYFFAFILVLLTIHMITEKWKK
ncbi:lamin tail domain-containing protein [Candidatus Woesearchaeota archaeon]|nr:lamin tail domain-containing protein [Candidatus Woesearchaeota archaeon]